MRFVHLVVPLALCVVLAGCATVGAGPVGPVDVDTPTGTAVTPPRIGTDPATSTPTSTATATSASTPTPAPVGTRTVEVDVRSERRTPFAVTLLLVDDPVDRVTVSYATGATRSYDVGTSGHLPDGALVDATGLRPDVPVAVEVSHADPTPTTGVGLGVPTAASDVVYVVTVAERVVGWAYVTCGASDVGRLEVTIRNESVSTTGVECLR